MKRNDIKALPEKSESELREMLQSLQKELATARLARQAGKLANTSSVKLLSDDIARVKTVLGLKEQRAATATTEKES
jgi:ribosomal protein L29